MTNRGVFHADIPPENRSLQPLIDCVNRSQSLGNSSAVPLVELAEIDKDFKFFAANHSLRRRIDFIYLNQ
jgi:hypothetical protein